MLDSAPPEQILDRILLLADPLDISSLAQTARFLREHTANNHLWHQLARKHFDHEPPTSGNSTIDWRKTLTARITLRQILATADDGLMKERLVCATAADPCPVQHRLTPSTQHKHYPGEQLLQLYQLLFLILSTATATAQPHSRNIAFLESLLANPTAQFRIIHYAGLNWQDQPVYALRDSLHDPLVAAAAKLHTLYGLTSFDINRSRARGIARESCYLLRNYSSNTLWGPFIPNPDPPLPPPEDAEEEPEDIRVCRVNWPHLEALSIIVGLNLHALRRKAQDAALQDDPEEQQQQQQEEETNPNELDLPLREILQHHGAQHEPPHLHHQLPGRPHRPSTELIPWPILQSLPNARPHTQLMHPAYTAPARPYHPQDIPRNPAALDLDQFDWAGVTGRWLRIVCFLDYRNLHAYNFGPGPPICLDQFDEAVRAMTLELRVVHIGILPRHLDPQGNPGPLVPAKMRTDVPGRPPIYFEGTSARNIGATSVPLPGQPPSRVRGYVSMTDDDEVRWSTVSTLAGAERWASEGIQVGGVRARWGVLGVWTDVDRGAVEAPVGPFYFYKTAY
ncbi:hypothetical protein PtB15_14B504 [Puccinia triticina]|nr:hypothetical protein PtB15_14B504 [Puccinia triticina]